MQNNELKSFILRHKVVVIVRRIYGDDMLNLAKAMYDGGVRLLEITFDQADPDCITKTCDAIRGVCALDGDMQVGAGTVLSTEQVDAAAAAGAKYIISPNTDEAVIRHTKAKGLVSIPGAMTPSEMMSAHQYGADFIKVFPMNFLGLDYIKAVMAPISHLHFVATGGVTEDNFADHLNAGMIGAGVSGRLTDRKLIAAGDFAELSKRAAAFVKIAKENGGA